MTVGVVTVPGLAPLAKQVVCKALLRLREMGKRPIRSGRTQEKSPHGRGFS
jgi:hypothetical protein